MQWSKFRSADSTDACLLVSTNGTCTVNRSIRYVFSALTIIKTLKNRHTCVHRIAHTDSASAPVL